MQNDMQQLPLDFHVATDNGYANWERDQQRAIQRVSQVWGLPLNQRVRLKLADIDSEFEGFLHLTEFPLDMDKRRPLTLKLTPLEFSSSEIEWCTVID